MRIPRHDEEDGRIKLVECLTHILDGVLPYVHRPGSLRMAAVLKNPVSGACFMWFRLRENPGIFNAASHVQVGWTSHYDRTEGRDRDGSVCVYEFQFDGSVTISDAESVLIMRLDTWKEGVEHLLQQLAVLLQEAAAWELKMAAALKSAATTLE